MGMDSDDLRRRKYPRVKETCRVKFREIEDGTRRPNDRAGVALNISGGGMCFASDHAVQPGAMLALEMSLEELPTPVVSLARVVWCEESESPGKFDVGAEFWWVGWADEDAQRRMLRYVHERLEHMEVEPK